MCPATFKCSGGTTSPLLNHMKAKHQQSYLEFREKKPIVFRNKIPVNEDDREANFDNESAMALTDLGEESFFDPLNSTEPEKVPIKQEHTSRTDKLVLSGEDFTNDLVSIFRELAKDTDFTNVTLVTEGGANFKAHKVVLSAFSPFFRNLLVNNPHQHPLLYLRGVQSEDLTAILDFIYLGQTKVDMENINKFMELARDLQIKGLAPTTDSIEEGVEERELFNDSLVNRGLRKVPKVTKPDAVQFPCHLCGYSSEERKDLMNHIEVKHTLSLQCYLCDFTCNKKEKLSVHMQTAHTDGVFSCDKCEFVSGSRESLAVHQSNHCDNVLLS